jgi:hypothetical protein
METIGDRLETVIFTRQSGNHGEYLGTEPGVFGVAKVDGQTFKVRSGVDLDAAWCWEVEHVASGFAQRCLKRWDLGLAAERLARLVRDEGLWELGQAWSVTDVPMEAFLAARAGEVRTHV